MYFILEAINYYYYRDTKTQGHKDTGTQRYRDTKTQHRMDTT